MTFKQEITNQIQANRPKLAASSIKTYASRLVALNTKLQPGNTDVFWFDKNAAKILKSLQDQEPSKRKSVLTALFVLTNNSKFHELMLQDAKHTNQREMLQVKTEKQEQNCLSMKLSEEAQCWNA